MAVEQLPNQNRNLRQYKNLSEQTPVVDLLHLRPFFLNAIEAAISKPDGLTNVWITGPVSAGKEVVTEQFLWLIENDQEFTGKLDEFKKRTGKEMRVVYLSTPMCNWSARERGRIQSPIGQFDRPEVEAHNQEMDHYLNQLDNEGGPQLRIVETVIHGYPEWPFGVGPLRHELQKEQNDPRKKNKLLYIFPTSELQDHGMEVRSIIANEEEEDAEVDVFNQNVFFDEILDKKELSQSWGNEKARKQVDEFGELAVMLRGSIIHDRLRELGISFPEKYVSRTGIRNVLWEKGTFQELKSNRRLRTQIFLKRALYIFNFVFEMDAEDFELRSNYLIPKETGIVVPFYRSLGRKYAMVVIEDEEYRRRLQKERIEEIQRQRAELRNPRTKLSKKEREQMERDLANYQRRKNTRKERRTFKKSKTTL